MATLSTGFRNKLERTVVEARRVAETGARAALEAFAVGHHEPFGHMKPEQRKQRTQLRARARQLGDQQDKSGRLELMHIAHECAYEHWHRMLFARFLAENGLLIEPDSGMAISLDECKELATAERGTRKAEGGVSDMWTFAGRCAQTMLPQIFRPDDPLLQVPLAREHQLKLEEKLDSLPTDVFTASDSLGWCYQFWQAEKKDQVNASGNKIGADELPAVTQLFTEDYMVDFLLDNTLGAWHAGKVLAANPKLAQKAKSEDELRKAVALPGVEWKYLRFVKDEKFGWRPAAGTFDGWPKTAKELKCLDPCMGSGHFVVAMFERLVALRIAEEDLNEKDAADAVIRDNMYGLEIDPRCTQIGAFNLALAAWRRVGYRVLPPMHIACSGLAPNTKKEEWLKLAGGNENLQRGMERLYQLFEKAPVLGSLINPRTLGSDLLVAGFNELQPLLEKALAIEGDENVHEMAVTAQGITKAAEILAGQFTLVATNVPYLGRIKQEDTLREYCDQTYRRSSADLATCFVERCLEFTGPCETAAVVSPQNWLFLTSYKSLRETLLVNKSISFIARLGPGAFETPMWDFNTMLLIVTASPAFRDTSYAGIDVANNDLPDEKAAELVTLPLGILCQLEQKQNPDMRIGLSEPSKGDRLWQHASIPQGIKTGDDNRFRLEFFELPKLDVPWRFYQSTPSGAADYSGMSFILRFSDRGSELARLQGEAAWGKRGVAISQMATMPQSYYLGDIQDSNINVVIPNQNADLTALVAFTQSDDFRLAIRALDQKLAVTNATVGKVPFDLAHWQKVAAKKYPRGLPKPFSSDPTQWLFDGHPKGSDHPLLVAVSRLLGYKWPRQTGSSFPDCPALKPDGLEKLEDKDGIVCIPSVRGEPPAADRLLEILTACGIKPDRDLDNWLRNEFFEEHCQLFHHRPFIWHIWDGRKRDGFHALVNYHKLADGAKGRRVLESLTHAYLNDWITRQKDGVKRGEGGAEERLAAALELKTRLEAILEGEPPYDIFVRWKPLAKQPIGWEPDINDGVRLNIRPFLASDIPGGKKGAGILRWKPNIKWDKDRGKEPSRPKGEFPWFWGWDEKTTDFKGGKEFDGNRWNDCHYTNEMRRVARKGAS